MKKVFVKWGYTDDYGRADLNKANFDWFATQEEAEAFAADMKKRNGGYFKLWKIAEGDYDKFVEMNELMKKLEMLKQDF